MARHIIEKCPKCNTEYSYFPETVMLLNGCQKCGVPQKEMIFVREENLVLG